MLENRRRKKRRLEGGRQPIKRVASVTAARRDEIRVAS